MRYDASMLVKMREAIEKAEATANQLEGSLSTLIEQLKAHGCDTIEEAEDKLDEIDREISGRENTLAEGIKKLETDYDWTVARNN